MSGGDVLAVAEHRRGRLRTVSGELVTAGRELADATGGDLRVAAVGGDAEAFAADLNRPGVDAVHPVGDGAEFNHDVYAGATCALVEELDPRYVLCPNSANGLDYAPAVATRLGVPVVTDATGLAHDGGLTVTRELYGSKVEATLAVEAARAVVTVRPGEWPAAEGEGDADVVPFAFAVDDADVRSRVAGFEDVDLGDVLVEDATVVVAVGRGISGAENLALVERLADALGATLAASGPVVDEGWLPKSRLVGQSGKTVAPEVYVAVGISGAIQHVAGMKASETVVAVNDDPDAPIFDVADYGVVGDLFEVVPRLVDAFE